MGKNVLKSPLKRGLITLAICLAFAALVCAALLSAYGGAAFRADSLEQWLFSPISSMKIWHLIVLLFALGGWFRASR
jgi:hypothetical protein